MKDTKAVILLSGGLDSATTAAIAMSQDFSLHALIFAYGQRHLLEITYAQRLAAFFNMAGHIIIEIPPDVFSSALISSGGIQVPRNRDLHCEHDIPVTYVPARNIIFLSYALAYAETIGARDIFIGAHAVDYSGYPDCRPEFFKAFSAMANVGTKTGVSGNGFVIHTPLIDMKKSDIIRKGIELGVDYSITHSCYDPSPAGEACGECDSCRIRRNGFLDAGVSDPTPYKK